MIQLKSKREIEDIRKACLMVAKVIEQLKKFVRPGATTKDIEQKARLLISQLGGIPAFKGYRGFPGYICTSVNEEVVHGIPGPRRLESGDIISLDIGVKLNGYFGDGAVTLAVGEVSQEAQRLLKVTEEALYLGIDEVISGNRLSDISCAIQSHVEGQGFQVVRDFVGHGIGTKMHEDPPVPNFGRPGMGPRLKPGMVLAIEPMVNMGTHKVRILEDGWTAVTGNGNLSAHFEHTVCVAKDKPEILTRD